MKICGRNPKIFSRVRQFHRRTDNKGSAMVVVIIAMAFIGILASVLMYMSLLNYQMKVNNLKAKDNFYSAETVLDEIRTAMGERVSASVGSAYELVLKNYEATSAEEKQNKLRYYFLKDMQDYYAVTGSMNINNYDLTKLFNSLSSEIKRGTVLETLNDSGEVVYRMALDSSGSLKVYVMTTDPVTGNKERVETTDIPTGRFQLYTDGLSFCGLKVTYTDTDGYVSVIQTDIRVKMPDMDFAQAVTLPSITGISMVAQENIQALPSDSTLISKNVIGGSFYAERFIVGSEEPGKGNGVTVEWKETTGNENEDKRMVMASDLYLGEGATLTTDQYGEVWAGSIAMNGGIPGSTGSNGTLSFQGNNVYVAGDLRMTGERNVFTAGAQIDGEYAGQYIGFGNGKGVDSSAILVNGTDTEIYLNELKNLTLAGNSYISLTKAKDGITSEDGVSNTGVQDVMMGQSIAVKSDQLAYLVPAQCIGVDASGKTVLNGASNPITLEQYKDKIRDQADVTEVALNIPSATLNGHTLAEYGLTQNNIQKIFKRINSKITLVYYYVSFDSTSDTARANANRYFQDYYGANQQTMEAYTGLYTKAIQVRGQQNGAYIMHLAGNVAMYDSSAAEGSQEKLLDATLTSDGANAGYQALLASDQLKFQALSKKMIDVYEQLLPSEKTDAANAYTNLVNEGEITTFHAVLNGSTGNKVESKYFGNTTGSLAEQGYKAVIVKGDYTYPEAGFGEFSGLIIATGDVKVTKEFQGTILSGGTITLDQNVNVEPDRDAVLHALTYSRTIVDAAGKTQEYHVVDFLNGGDGYLSSNGKSYKNSDINLGDLIVYENWQKE